MPNQKNIQTVQNLKEKFSKATSVTFADYIGLSAKNAGDLRQKIKDGEGETLVAKNTLIKVAIEESTSEGLKKAKEDLTGQTLVILSYSDPIGPIKAIFDFTKDSESPRIKSAIVEGIYKDEQKVQEIKDIPSKEVLLARLVGSLNSPISGLVNTFSGVQRKFVYAIKAIADSKPEGGAN
jgi:large subunit ribosomal protein L10